MQAPAHVLIAGASGFLGAHLTDHLRTAGHRVTALVRREPGPQELRWDPYTASLAPQTLEGVDVVVNLAGSPLIGNPHSRRWAHDVMHSRVTTTRVLAEAIAERASDAPAPAFVAGNGMAWYGDHGDEVLTESSDSRGDALLTRVTRAWQAATEPAQQAGARVCVLRTAVVIDQGSSPFKVMRPVYRAGLGTRLGSGTQYFPIVSRHDWVGAAAFLATETDASGVFNLTSPEPPTHAEFCAAIAAPRKVRLVVPGAVVRRGAGAMAPELLGSVRATPEALLRAGFTFRDHDVTAVVSAALGQR